VGYPDLILTPWVMGRKAPLEVYGPKGIKAMTDHVLAAWREDIEERISTETWQPANYRDTYQVHVHEISSGVIYKDTNRIPDKACIPGNLRLSIRHRRPQHSDLGRHDLFSNHH
jgi:ribonuclease BN (tRNA processing enzyme)